MSMVLGGFGNAPVSKGLLVLTAGASVIHQATKLSRVSSDVGLELVRHAFVFRHPGELLMGSILIYYFRELERRFGSNKFTCFYGLSMLSSLSLQFLAAKFFDLRLGSSGPYGYLFASFVQFFSLIPPSAPFNIAGWNFSDKTFIYMAGIQLVISGGVPTTIAAATGVIGGMAYKMNLFGVKRLRVPKFIASMFGRLLGPLLEGQRPQVRPARAERQGTSAAATNAAQLRIGSSPSRPSPAPDPPPHVLPEPSPEAVETLVGMGFDRHKSARALEAAGNDIQAAINHLV